MSKLIGRLVVGLAVCWTGLVNAALVGNKDWLQVRDTTGFSWNQMDAIFDTTSGECDVAGCLLGGTIDLTGYKWASAVDVDNLIMSLAGGPGFSSFTSNNTINMGIDGLDPMMPIPFQNTYATPGELLQITGYTRDNNPATGRVTQIKLNKYYATFDNFSDEASLGAENLATIASDFRGFWMYRTTEVPVPAAAWLFGSALLGLGALKRRKANRSSYA